MKTINTVIPANERYIQLSNEVEQQIKVLQQMLKGHKEKQSKDTRNYGFVGDMAYILDKINTINQIW